MALTPIYSENECRPLIIHKEKRMISGPALWSLGDVTVENPSTEPHGWTVSPSNANPTDFTPLNSIVLEGTIDQMIEATGLTYEELNFSKEEILTLEKTKLELQQTDLIKLIQTAPDLKTVQQYCFEKGLTKVKDVIL